MRNDDEVGLGGAVPLCPTDGMRMNATIVGWRCPICGLARLPEVA
jgi:tRNA(Ile2) C34 agmatinyltransferase TiaS